MTVSPEDVPVVGMRALFLDKLELRDATPEEEAGGYIGTLVGYLARFNEWTEIDSAIEGHFLEQVAPRAFTKTFREGVGRIRCIFHHGNDPTVGVRVLGPVNVLEEQAEGAWAEVPLLDTSYNRDLAPGIRAGLYGMSFRFRAVRQNMVRFPKKSEHNPQGIPERTLVELAIPEFGPTPFAAYAGATAGMRSLTDELFIDRLASDPRRLEELARRSGMVPFFAADTENDNVKCQQCGEMNADDAVFCDQCGAKLANPGGAPYSRGADENVQCPQCGKYNEDDAEFCDQCGESLEEDAAAESAETANGRARVTTEATRAGAPSSETRVVTERLYQRAVSFAVTHPWEMMPETLAIVQAILAERASGYRPSDEEIAERLGTRSVDELVDPEVVSPVAVIPIIGPIMPRASMFSMSSSGASVTSLQEQFRAALANPAVETILFNVDSPGGSSAMIPELTDEIAAARGQKPMVAVANTLMASAAYHLMCQVDEIVGSPSADIGSIGVYATHQDVTGELEKLGRKVTLVHSEGSPHKTEMQPFVELSEDAQAELQRRVNDVMDGFVEAVASGRGTTSEDVLANYGGGRVLSSKDALRVGMIDRIDTFDATLARLEAAASTAPARGSADVPDVHPAESGAELQGSHPAKSARRGIDPKTLMPKEEPRWLL